MHGNVLCFVQHVDYGGAREAAAAAAAFAECGSTRTRTWAATLLSILRGRSEKERKMSTLNAAKMEYRDEP